MTLEEKLVQRIKGTTLFELVEDEEALRVLTDRAIKEALFKPREIKNGYHTVLTDSSVVAAAREAVQGFIRERLAAHLDTLMADPEQAKEVRSIIADLMPQALRDVLGGLLSNYTRAQEDHAKILIMNWAQNGRF
jgi:hypothetical protein